MKIRRVIKMIFANHAHVFPKEIRPEGSVESLMRFLDECEIDKAVAFAPFSDRFQVLPPSHLPERVAPE